MTGLSPAGSLARALRDDRGSGPAAVLAWTALASLILAVVMALGIVHVTQARAASAADLAAVSAADALSAGGDPCPVAARVAAANGAALGSCSVHGQDVVVSVEMPAGRFGTVSVSARAGPPPAAAE